EDGIRDRNVTGVQTCALPISSEHPLGLTHPLGLLLRLLSSRWQSTAKIHAAPLETVQAAQEIASAHATLDQLPTAAARLLASLNRSSSCVPPHTSMLKVLRRPIESAAAFFRNSFSIRSSRTSASSSASRTRSEGFIAGSG